MRRLAPSFDARKSKNKVPRCPGARTGPPSCFSPQAFRPIVRIVAPEIAMSRDRLRTRFAGRHKGFRRWGDGGRYRPDAQRGFRGPSALPSLAGRVGMSSIGCDLSRHFLSVRQNLFAHPIHRREVRIVQIRVTQVKLGQNANAVV